MPHYDLVIIGTGSGNPILTKKFADWKVALVERGTFGGTCLNVGCIPTKMFVHTADLAAAPRTSSRLGVDETLDGVRWTDIRDRIFGRIDPISASGLDYRLHHENNGNVTVYRGDAVFTGHKRLTITPNDGGQPEIVSADHIVLAAGGRPVIPEIDGLADIRYHTSDTVMRLEALPRRLAILGGGAVAAEFAHVFSSFGAAVTVIARSNALLQDEDDDVSARFTELAQEKWDVRLNSKLARVEPSRHGIRLCVEGMTDEDVIDVDQLLVATGRRPNTDQLKVDASDLAVRDDGHLVVDQHQQTSVEGIWALGDISSPWSLKHVANHEARVVQHNLLHPDDLVASDHRFVPHAVFTSPQIAAVGRTERQAAEQGIDYVASARDYADVAYGWAMEDTTSFAKVLADRHSGQLIGAHIIGPQASSLIQPLIQAMSFGLDARSMARGQYWIHPSLPEVVENTVLDLDLHAGAAQG